MQGNHHFYYGRPYNSRAPIRFRMKLDISDEFEDILKYFNNYQRE